jgi:prepilin-type N-terminal cleavage/methylation domain-containing protein
MFLFYYYCVILFIVGDVMKKRGFTLVEVLAVIVVLGLLIAMITPVVTNLIKDSEDTLYKKQVDSIVVATKKYMVEHSELLPNVGESYSVCVSDLINLGVIDSEQVIDPKSKNEMTGCVSIVYDENFNQYEYNYSDGIEYVFEYTGAEQVFVAPISGRYKLEVWGAQGGSTTYYRGGYGGYSSGVINLLSGDTLYINVGGQGSNGSVSAKRNGGYNGGGYVPYSSDSTSRSVSGGGGATHIALESGLLSDLSGKTDKILIVAGGGGGGYAHSSSGYEGIGGDAGGASGVAGSYNSGGCPGTGGTQSSGGNGCGATASYGKFGLGGNVGSKAHGSAGGGGFYGGGASKGEIGSNGNSGGGGGSGYIGNSLLFNGVMYCYGCTENSNSDTLTISTIGSDPSLDTVSCSSGYSITPISRCAKALNGYVRITSTGISN